GLDAQTYRFPPQWPGRIRSGWTPSRVGTTGAMSSMDRPGAYSRIVSAAHVGSPDAQPVRVHLRPQRQPRQRPAVVPQLVTGTQETVGHAHKRDRGSLWPVSWRWPTHAVPAQAGHPSMSSERTATKMASSRNWAVFRATQAAVPWASIAPARPPNTSPGGW